MDIVIRKATVEDLPAVQKLGTELMLSEIQFDLYLDKDWYANKYGAAYLLKEIKGRNHICFVAEAGDQLVGYASCKVLPKDTSRPMKRAELDNLVVSEKYRGHGVGHKLVAAFKQWAKTKQATKVKVIVNAHNAPGIHFYENNGFKDHHLVMEADL